MNPQTWNGLLMQLIEDMRMNAISQILDSNRPTLNTDLAYSGFSISILAKTS